MLRPANLNDITAIFPLIDIIWQDMDFPLRRLLTPEQFKQTMLEIMALPTSKFSYTNCWVNQEENLHISGILYSYAGHLEPAFDEQFFTFVDQRFPELTIRQFADNRESNDEEWYLDSLVVDKDYRGQGIGTHFFNHLPHITTYQLIGLNCDFNNPKAKKLYEQLGFQTTETTRFLNHTYHHMQKTLPKNKF